MNVALITKIIKANNEYVVIYLVRIPHLKEFIFFNRINFKEKQDILRN